MRTIPAAVLAGLRSPAPRPCALIELDYPTGFVRLHSWIGDFTLLDDDGSSLTFNGVGDLGQISGVEQPEELRGVDITASLTGLDPALVATHLAEDYQGRDFRIWLGLVADGEAGLVDDYGLLIAAGEINHAVMVVGATARIDLKLRNHLDDWDRPKISRYSDEEQQRLHPGDTFCSRVAVSATREIVWGRK